MKHIAYQQIFWIWVITLVFSTAALLLIDIPAAKPGDLEGFQAYLDRTIPASMESHDIPGAAVGLIHNGKIVDLKGYGFA
ncbi:MAG TPA: hypothetical protein VHO48_11270, partial [Anaerolineaceae bacterium]|nr:hypothetical protein [Anaerolineaceae bacterium]